MGVIRHHKKPLSFMKIQPAIIEEFDKLYQLGKNAPEMRVSATEEFMTTDEFEWAICNPHGVFLTAQEDNALIGFIYADIKDYGKPLKNIYACIVFLVVVLPYRRKSVATKLYQACIDRLIKMGCTHAYVWAHAEGNSEIIRFMEKQDFNKGHKYLWMDKKI